MVQRDKDYTNAIRILVIDDSHIVGTVISRVISQHSDCLVVGSALTIADGRAMIARLRPDVITLDLSMPGFGGLQFLDEFGLIGRPAVVVVSASTSARALAADEAIRHGADACFDKAHLLSDAVGFVRTLKDAARLNRAHRRRSGGAQLADEGLRRGL